MSIMIAGIQILRLTSIPRFQTPTHTHPNSEIRYYTKLSLLCPRGMRPNILFLFPSHSASSTPNNEYIFLISPAADGYLAWCKSKRNCVSNVEKWLFELPFSLLKRRGVRSKHTNQAMFQSPPFSSARQAASCVWTANMILPVGWTKVTGTINPWYKRARGSWVEHYDESSHATAPQASLLIHLGV